jgi:hypothetical protein
MMGEYVFAPQSSAKVNPNEGASEAKDACFAIYLRARDVDEHRII